MFTRKLTVLLLPLAMLTGVCLLLPLMSAWGLPGQAAKGALLGLALALLLPLSGATRQRERFAWLLWFPALLCAALIVWQLWGAPLQRIPALNLLRTADADALLGEGAFSAFMIVTCLRTRG